jgi:putative transposase
MWTMKQKRTYQYRVYPTDEQKQILARTFGCARFVYNWALRLRTEAYNERQERIGYHELSARLTLLKQSEPSYDSQPGLRFSRNERNPS